MRWICWGSTAVLAGVAATGLSHNAGKKFVRTRVQQGCRWTYANAAATDDDFGDLICCTGSSKDDAVCFAGRNPATKILTSEWALVIPLAALAVNALCDWFAGGVTAARTRARWNRFWLYVAVILGRTLLLYLGLNYIQDVVQPEESSNCWYAHLRRSGKCSEHFDFADHVILAVCQYLAIQVFELCCILQEYRDFPRRDAIASSAASSPLRRKSSPTPSCSSSSSSPHSPRRSPPSSSSSPLVSVVSAAAVGVAVAGAALLLVYDTESYFHTRAETAAALAISWVAVWSPLLSLTGGVVGIRGVFLAPTTPVG